MLAVYVASVFTGAFLMFLVQPMVARMVLPFLGGTPAVWNTAMVFFQAALLAGYAYAHLLTRSLPFRVQVPVHLALMAAAAMVLPIVIGPDATPPAHGSPVSWMIGLMAATAGPPFLAVSATAPLLQRWFALGGHANPYFLYSASNLGSILALLAYPFLVEPNLRLIEQGRLWAGGYLLLVALVAAAAWTTHRTAMSVASVASVTPEGGATPVTSEGGTNGVSWRRRAHWAALAFLPSSLLLGVTTHLTTDVAAIPLFWIVPLVLYLLTFVLAFAGRGGSWAFPLQTVAVPLLAFQFYWPTKVLGLMFLVHLLAFFATALVCHGELAARKPQAGHLTDFYLWMSVGGVLGGAFNALLAPVAFTGAYEYPLVLLLAMAARPGPWPTLFRELGRDLAPAAVLLGGAVALEVLTSGASSAARNQGVEAVLFVAVLTLAFMGRERPLMFAACVLAAFSLNFRDAAGLRGDGEHVIDQRRSFFGIHRTWSDERGIIHALVHGSTLHGSGYAAPGPHPEPLAYYHREGPLGQVFGRLEALGRAPGHVGLIGLGAGASVCYRKPGQSWTVYEIDPVVEAIARDARYFHFMEKCGQEVPVVLGDARLTLARHAGDRSLDLLIVDAFSSDSVPAHLITREALTLYFRKLAPGGILMFHVSNRFIDLWPVLARGASDAGAAARIQAHDATGGPLHGIHREKISSTWVVMAQREDTLLPLVADGRWTAPGPGLKDILWTDDFFNILGVLRWSD